VVMFLVQGARQCDIYVVHIVGLDGKNGGQVVGSLLQVHSKGCLCHEPFIHRVINKSVT